MMLLRPTVDDVRVIGSALGWLLVAGGALQMAPAAVAVVLGEWNAASAFVLGASLTVLAGRSMTLIRAPRRMELSHAMVVVALAWLLVAASGAIPLYLSGHFRGFLQAYFEAMSGFTTSGLSMLEDIDHLAVSMNLWRHLMQFVGGQGIIIVVLGLYSGAVDLAPDALYQGEAREDHVVPNIVRTARFIYLLAGVYLVLGTSALLIVGIAGGLEPGRALFHGLTQFMAGFDTGGFSPTSASIAFYHSAAYETVLLTLMVAGALSFGLHYDLWHRDRRELFRSTEVRAFATSLAATAVVLLAGLLASGTFTTAGGIFRSGIFTIISAHTGTGFGVNPGRMYATDWGVLAPAAIVAAMALGPMASSTGGGIKAIRVAIAVKGILRDIARAVNPPNTLVVATYHSRIRRPLRDDQVRGAAMILLLYLFTYLAGGFVGLFYGYPFTESLFESTSATANVGLSVGIVDPGIPAPLTVAYTLQMWLGRLEFMAALALFAFGVNAIGSRRRSPPHRGA